MIGQARFIYTAKDMIAAQRAGLAWHARWRNLVIGFVGIALVESAILAGLNAAYGTRGVFTDLIFVLLASAVLTPLIVGLLFVSARNSGQQALRGNRLLGGEHDWGWDQNGLRLRSEQGSIQLPWSSVGAWLDAPDVLLLFPSASRAFSLPERVLAAGWRDAAKVFLSPFGGFALILPKRALAAGDFGHLVDTLRRAGVQERRRFGIIAATMPDAE